MAKNQLLTQIIDEIKYREKITQSQIADKIGVSTQYLSDVKSGRFPLSSDLCDKLRIKFTYVHNIIEQSGEGEMLNSDVTPVVKSDLKEWTETKAGMRFFERDDSRLVMQVPIVPIEALGSPEDEYATFIRDYEGETVVIEVGEVHHGKYLAFKVSGDSMDDGTKRGFEKGDIAVVRELGRDKWLPKLHFGRWPFWVVVFGNNVRIKEIIAQDETTGAITLHSLNPSPEYTDFTLQLDQISRLFNVVERIPHSVKF